MHQAADLMQFQRRTHSRGSEHERVILASLSAWIHAQRLETSQHLFTKFSAEPFVIEQCGLRRDNLCFCTGCKKLSKQRSCLPSPQRLDRPKVALVTDPLDPHLVFIKKDVSEYHVRKGISRQLTQYALEFFFVGFPRAATAHKSEIQQARLPSQHFRTQAVRSAARSIFCEHRQK